MSQEQQLREWVRQGESESGCRVVTISGGKGGVGKTNLAVALSLAAASRGRRTYLLDGDLGLANIDVLFNLEPHQDLAHVLAGRARLDDVLIELPFGLNLVPGASGITRLADLRGAEPGALERVFAQLEEQADLIVVDTGAGISRDVVDFCVLSGEVVVVTTPEPTAITDAYALIKVLVEREPGIDIWLLVNMARDSAEGDATLRRISDVAERFLGTSIRSAGIVLSDDVVGAAVRDRQPFSLAYPHSSAHASVLSISRTLGLDRNNQRGASSFFRRVRSLFSGPPTPGARDGRD